MLDTFRTEAPELHCAKRADSPSARRDQVANLLAITAEAACS